MGDMIKNFFSGLVVIPRGWQLIRQVPGALRLLLVPFFLYFVLFLIGLYIGPAPLQSLLNWIFSLDMIIDFQGSSGWPNFTRLLLWIVYIVFLTYFVFIIANVISAPVLGLLAEKILNHLQGDKKPEVRSYWKLVLSQFLLFWWSLLKIFIFLMIAGLLFFIGIIPGFHFLALFGIFLMMSFDCADFTFEAYYWNLKKRGQFFLSHFDAFLGVALSLSITVIIPGFNFIVYPAAIAGGVELIHGLQRKQISQESK